MAAQGSNGGGGSPPQIVALIILVATAFLFWLQTTKRLGPILQTITAGTPGPGTPTGGGGTGSFVTPAQSGIPGLAMGLMGGGGGIVGINGTVGGGGIAPTSTQWGQSVSDARDHAKSSATDAALAAVASTGPIGIGAAMVAKLFHWRF